MSDLISRQDAIDAFDGIKVDLEDCTEYDIGYNDGIDYAVTALSVMPSAQRTGHWINRSLNILYPEWERYICSSCGKCSNNYNYCPNCGARMEREEE